jgi:hypothetical protein
VSKNLNAKLILAKGKRRKKEEGKKVVAVI